MGVCITKSGMMFHLENHVTKDLSLNSRNQLRRPQNDSIQRILGKLCCVELSIQLPTKTQLELEIYWKKPFKWHIYFTYSLDFLSSFLCQNMSPEILNSLTVDWFSLTAH